jgi:hypothetical protein
MGGGPSPLPSLTGASTKRLSAGGLPPLVGQGSSAFGRGPSTTAASISSVGSQVQMLRLQTLRGEEVGGPGG